MRLVTYLNETYFKEMISELEGGFQNLAWKFDHYSPGDYPKPQRMQQGEHVFPFPLAAELYHIHAYLSGVSDPPSTMYNTLQNVCELVWTNPFTSAATYQIEWEIWERTKLGAFIRCSFIAIALEAGESINSKQLAMMTGMTSPGIVKNIKSGKLRAEKEVREWVIQADDALQFINEQKIAQKRG
jgi:hypothetical protein